MNWIKKIFANKLKTRSDYEKMLLGRLEKFRVHTEYDGKTFYTDNDKEIFKVKILGRYEYYDVDGTVSNMVAEKEDGEIVTIQFQFLYTKRPHDWVIYLTTFQKSQYSEQLRIGNYDELTTKFLDKLPKDIAREIKINTIIK